MKKIFVIIFGIIYLSFSVYNLTVPQKEFLENENRYAKKMPEFSFSSLVDGGYTKDFEEHITDKTAFRDFFVSLKSNLEKLTFKKESNGVYFAHDDYLIQTYQSNYDKNIVSNNINAINKLAKEKDLNVSFALIPTAYEVLKEKLPKYSYNSYQLDLMEYAKENLNNVNFINPTDSLNQNKDDYIYYKTDHHQTANGSFIVYSDIMKKMGITPYSKGDFEIKTVSDDFYGTTWSKATINLKGDKIIKYEPEFNVSYKVNYDLIKESDSLYEEKNIAIKDKYTYYLDGNHGITTIKTNFSDGGKLTFENGKKLAVIKDSYAHSIIPFIANHYSEIVVFDLRYYNLSIPKYLKENGISDVLFIYNTDNFLTDYNLNKISAYLQDK